jgi:hypothetical protein
MGSAFCGFPGLSSGFLRRIRGFPESLSGKSRSNLGTFAYRIMYKKIIKEIAA